jgi:ketosteroid isomerase-like protein
MAKRPERGKKLAGGGARPREVQSATARKFLNRYQEAWETRNADLAASLFTRDAHYWENPFGAPIIGREAIRVYWEAATHAQEEIHFEVKNSFHHHFTLVAEWTCKYRYRVGGNPHRRFLRPAGSQLPRMLAPPSAVGATCHT